MVIVAEIDMTQIIKYHYFVDIYVTLSLPTFLKLFDKYHISLSRFTQKNKPLQDDIHIL